MNELDSKTAKKVRENCMSGDYDTDHYFADRFLTLLLTHLGYHETVAAWDKVGKWYS